MIWKEYNLMAGTYLVQLSFVGELQVSLADEIYTFSQANPSGKITKVFTTLEQGTYLFRMDALQTTEFTYNIVGFNSISLNLVEGIEEAPSPVFNLKLGVQ